MMCAALPDEPAPTISVSQTMPVETVVETTVETVVETTTESSEVETTVNKPIHVMQQKFSAQKRLKKAHVETLESVYRKTKRPTVSESFVLNDFGILRYNVLSFEN